MRLFETAFALLTVLTKINIICAYSLPSSARSFKFEVNHRRRQVEDIGISTNITYGGGVWTTPVDIGSQTLDLLIDTGSGALYGPYDSLGCSD